jgi:hypothetical protein
MVCELFDARVATEVGQTNIFRELEIDSSPIASQISGYLPVLLSN